MNKLTLTSNPDAPDADKKIVGDGLMRHNVAMTGDDRFRSVALFLRDDSGAIQGGLLGNMWGGRMYVGTLWVAEGYRSQGNGSRLIAAAEAEARANNCRGIDLSTFSFQGRPFYEKHGFEVFATIDDFPPTHTFYFMRKELDGPAAG